MRRLALIAIVVACHAPTPFAPAPPPKVFRSGFEVSTPKEAGLAPEAVATMMEHAKASRSDAVIVLRNGKIAIEEYFGHGEKPIMAMSASKSITSLAIAVLKKANPELSLDEPISKTFPS